MVQETRRHRRKPKKHSTDQETISDYKQSQISGGKFSHHSPIFTKDEKYVVLATRTEARLYSTSNGDLVRSFYSISQLGPIVSLFLHPLNEFRLVVVGRGGTIVIYDWTDGVVLQKSHIRDTEIIAAVMSGKSFFWSDGKEVVCLDDIDNPADRRTILTMKICEGLQIVNDHLYAYGDKHVVRMGAAGSSKTVERLNLESSFVAICFYGDILAYCTENGAIFLQNMTDKTLTPRKLHWHASAAHSLAFALDGQYLMSAGQEGVLVLWQLTTTNKQFLPRIASTINVIGVSASSRLYALKLDDNSVKIISAATLALQAEIVGPRYTDGSISATRDKEHLYLANCNELQTWHLSSGRTVSTTNITAKTFAGKNRDFNVHEPQATACATQGEWLATIDTWSLPQEDMLDLGYGQDHFESSLKFWQKKQGQWQLVSKINNPHGHRRTDQIVPCSKGFYTVGEDAMIKLWRQKPIRKDLLGGGTETVGLTWSCRRVFRTCREAKRYRIALSQDESTLALSSNDTVHMICAKTGNLKHILPDLNFGKTKKLGFINRWLIILGTKALVCFDLIAYQPQYTVLLSQTTSRSLLSCGRSTFALTTTDSESSKMKHHIRIWKPASAKTIFRERTDRALELTAIEDDHILLSEDLEIITYSRSKPKKSTVSTTTKHKAIEDLYPKIMPSQVSNEVIKAPMDYNSICHILSTPSDLETRYLDLVRYL